MTRHKKSKWNFFRIGLLVTLCLSACTLGMQKSKAQESSSKNFSFYIPFMAGQAVSETRTVPNEPTASPTPTITATSESGSIPSPTATSTPNGGSIPSPTATSTPKGGSIPNPTPTATPISTEPPGTSRIEIVSTNLGDYADGAIPQYEKFEITLSINTSAENVNFPYDFTPPPGIKPELGVTVNAFFSPDNWTTVFIQPAFYYEHFEEAIKKNDDWFYPTGESNWKVRFAPHQQGVWQYKIAVQDKDGHNETDASSFRVAASSNKGFIRVSERDRRYFEHNDGTYFPGLGYNLNYRRVDWINPTENQSSFQKLRENNIQLLRIWLSQWSIFGSAWSPWKSLNPAHQTQGDNSRLRHDAGPPFSLTPGVDSPIARQDSDVFLWLSHDETKNDKGQQRKLTPCMVLGWESPLLAVKPNTDYRMRVRYKEQGLIGPKVAGHPFGFTVKIAGWLWNNNDETKRCSYPGTGTVVAATYSTTEKWHHYADPENGGWSILEGNLNSGDNDFLDRLYLTIENATAGNVFVDYVWLEEVKGNEEYGPNIVYKPWMAQHFYFDQRNSYAFDKVLDFAKQNDVYLKLVILEKSDYLLNIHEKDGTLSTYSPKTNPEKLFFGRGRELEGKTKTRWLQEAWWRYLQARWGFSPNIHSWELLNEGDPGDALHYILADELGKYFRTQFIPKGQQIQHPNIHLVTTSFWSRFPNQFWSNPAYAYIDYADIHHYAQESRTKPLQHIYELSDFYDAALFSQKLSMYHGANRPNGAGKPIMRGETGYIFDGPDLFEQNVSNGLWLHNLVWGGINSGGLIESFWVGAPTHRQIYQEQSHDHRSIFRSYYNFIDEIPLNNGHYEDLNASVGNEGVRVWGQKDLVNGCAHIWIQNRQNTWKHAADARPVEPISTTFAIDGFKPSQSYSLEWWDTYKTVRAEQIFATEIAVADAEGVITITVDALVADFALRIKNQNKMCN